MAADFDTTTTGAGIDPRYNALKHGQYAESTVLPGENAAEFERQRKTLYQEYLPQTEDEAELVESLAEFRWLRRRCRAIQTRLDGQAVAPEQDAAGRLCEPMAHQREHTSIDGTKQRQRIERLWNGARNRLIEAQRMRRLGLVAGAVKLPPGCYLDASGELRGPVTVEIACQPAPEVRRLGPTPSIKPQSTECEERKEIPAPPVHPELAQPEIPARRERVPTPGGAASRVVYLPPDFATRPSHGDGGPPPLGYAMVSSL